MSTMCWMLKSAFSDTTLMMTIPAAISARCRSNARSMKAAVTTPMARTP